MTEDSKPYIDAVIKGTRYAAETLSSMGHEVTQHAYSGSVVKIPGGTIYQLSIAGRASTLRVYETLRSGRLTDEELISAFEDISSHPWDDGPLRKELERQIGWKFDESDELSTPAEGELLEALEEEIPAIGRGVSTVAAYIAREYNLKSIKDEVSEKLTANDEPDWTAVTDFFNEAMNRTTGTLVSVEIPELKKKLTVTIPSDKAADFFKAMPLYGAEVETME